MNTQSAKFFTTMVAAVAAGIPIWTVSYRDLNITDPSFLAIWFLIGITVTLVASLLSSMNSGELIGAITVGFTIAIIIRFLGDMFFGSPGHSNLGLGLMVAVGIGAFSSWVGSFAILIRKSKRTTPK